MTESTTSVATPTIEPQSSIQRFQATVRRTFSKRDDAAKPVQLIRFKPKGLHYEHASSSDGELNNPSCSTGIHKFHRYTHIHTYLLLEIMFNFELSRVILLVRIHISYNYRIGDLSYAIKL